MTKTKLLAALPGAMLIAAPAVMLALPAAPALAVGDGNGQDATRCISLEDNSLYNGCGVVVEAAWCVENVDCRGGRYTNTWTLGSGVSYPVQGASTGNTVRYAACVGRNSIEDVGDSYTPYRHRCNSGN